MAFNVPETSESTEIDTFVQNQIHVDGINVKVLPAGSNPNVVYRIGDGTVHPEGWDNVLNNEYLDFYVAAGASAVDIEAIASEVVAVSAITSEIVTVSGVTGDITTVAGIAADVTTVAGISADVSFLAANWGSKIDATGVTYENLNTNGDVGTGATQVAQGDHNHTGVYEPADATILKDADIGVTLQAYDVDTAKTDVAQNYTAPQRSAGLTDNDGSFDLGAKQNFICTPTGTFALTFTNIPDGQSGTIILDNSGGHVVTAAATTKVDANFLATVSTAGKYAIGYYSDGTNVYVYNSGALA